ncbi:504_t:CDS:2, partial [Gigaspora margarita]
VKDQGDSNQIRKQDEDLFQTARLVNCGFYLNIIIHDYLHIILGLYQTNSTWFLDPTTPYGEGHLLHALPTGMGNQVSLEFNYIYRWHPAVSQEDEKWIEREFKNILGDNWQNYKVTSKFNFIQIECHFVLIWVPKEIESPILHHDLNQISINEFWKKLADWKDTLPTDPSIWSFKDIARLNDGYFNNADIAKALISGTKHVAGKIKYESLILLSIFLTNPSLFIDSRLLCAGAFGPNHIPKVFRIIERIGMESARATGVGSLNEFRRFLNLVPYKSFEDMNPDKEVIKKLRALYGHIDNVELYPGLMTEKTKPSMLGSGIALPFTISRGILSDAVNLVRNDRFYTDDFNPYNLTSWGWNEIQSDPNITSGSIMYKLILRHVPGFYKPNSVFALYPFTVPSITRENLKNRGDDYWKSLDYDEPVNNTRGPKVSIKSYNDAMTVLSKNDVFHVTYTDDMKWMIKCP